MMFHAGCGREIPVNFTDGLQKIGAVIDNWEDCKECAKKDHCRAYIIALIENARRTEKILP